VVFPFGVISQRVTFSGRRAATRAAAGAVEVAVKVAVEVAAVMAQSPPAGATITRKVGKTSRKSFEKKPFQLEQQLKEPEGEG